jgi:hypothetical protein
MEALSFEFEVLTETRSAAGKRGRAALLLLREQAHSSPIMGRAGSGLTI